jgi:tetratricopeptide (TPR) repeat protein
MIIRVIDGIGGLEMDKETDFYTGTMAKVYASQGHWDKAAEIYRHLLRMEPERTDYLEALAEAERMLSASGKRPGEDLEPLFHQWIDLMLKYKNLQKLRRLKR